MHMWHCRKRKVKAYVKWGINSSLPLRIVLKMSLPLSVLIMPSISLTFFSPRSIRLKQKIIWLEWFSYKLTLWQNDTSLSFSLYLISIDRYLINIDCIQLFILVTMEGKRGVLYKHFLDSECWAYLEVGGRKRGRITNSSGDMLKELKLKQQNNDRIWL